MITQARKIGAILFRWRDLLPIPLAALMAKVAKPSFFSWILGLPFIVAGETLRLWSLMHIGPTTRTRAICADRLIVSGPYAIIRNPLYLGNLLKVAGFVTIAGNFPFAVLVLCFYAFEYATVIPFEESFLQEKFPKDFADYCRKVPVFIPKSFQNALEALKMILVCGGSGADTKGAATGAGAKGAATGAGAKGAATGADTKGAATGAGAKGAASIAGAVGAAGAGVEAGAPHSFFEALRSEKKTFGSSGTLLAILLFASLLRGEARA